MGRIINAMHRLNEKLITIWKSEGLVAKGEIRPPPVGRRFVSSNQLPGRARVRAPRPLNPVSKSVETPLFLPPFEKFSTRKFSTALFHYLAKEVFLQGET